MGAMKEFLEAVGEVATDVAASPITREAINDVRGMAHETYFGQPEHAPGAGTPMSPLPREVYEQKQEIEKQPEKDMDMDM